MHHDEANQAVKFGALLEKGEYRYDRADHHGPSLYYLSLPFARVLGADRLAELNERTIRLVPAFFGLGAVILLLLFVPLIGKERVLWSALGLALSPVLVYFSRFYIQETLLLFFLAGFVAAVWRYERKPSWTWAVTAGFFAGMMYATKETSVIAFGSIAAALLLGSFLRREKRGDRPALGKLGREDTGPEDMDLEKPPRSEQIEKRRLRAQKCAGRRFRADIPDGPGDCDSRLHPSLYFVFPEPTRLHRFDPFLQGLFRPGRRGGIPCPTLVLLPPDAGLLEDRIRPGLERGPAS